MKKRILCAIMSAVMIVGVMTGCGSKETSSNKTVENASEKTEDKYAERMEAYLDYFQSEEKDYDGVVGAAITLDSDSLPLLWLAYSDSEEFEDVRFQLCSYEKNKVEVLAEKKVDDVGGMFPYNDTGIIGMRLEIGDNEDSSTVALVYLQDEQDFEVFEADYFDYDEKVDIEEYCKKMQDDIDIYRIINGQCNFLTLNYADKTAYLGISDRNQIYYDMLDNIGALDYSTSSSEADMMQQARKLSDKYKDNKFVSEIFNEHFELERDDRYFVKSTLCLPDGTELDENDIDEYLGISKKEIEDDGVSINQTGNYFRFCVDKDAELLMRNLKKNPAYTPFDLLLVFAKINEDIYNGMYSDLQFGDIVDVKELLKDAADNKDNSVDSTESIRREDSTEISKETNNTMPAWKQAYIDYISGLDGKVTGYKFVDINSDGQPELCIMYSNGNSLGLLNYTKSGDIELIPALGLVSNFSYGDNKIMDDYTRNGTATDYVYSYNSSTGEFDKVFDGGYDENYTDGTTNNYRFLGQEITETTKEEYESKLKEAKGNTDFTWLGDGFLADDVITAIQDY